MQPCFAPTRGSKSEREWCDDGGSGSGSGTASTEVRLLVGRLGQMTAWASGPVMRAACKGWRRRLLPLVRTCNFSIVVIETMRAMHGEERRLPHHRAQADSAGWC